MALNHVPFCTPHISVLKSTVIAMYMTSFKFITIFPTESNKIADLSMTFIFAFHITRKRFIQNSLVFEHILIKSNT